MKVSRAWLQKYFDTKLGDTQALAEALTFHAFEIEEYDDDLLDIKVLPDRACYALSHRGIAVELGAILELPIKNDPLRSPLSLPQETTELSITCDPAYVIRHTGALVKGVNVGPSPEWLQQALMSVGQRSINNVVDVLNYVMLDIGQPSGAFDTGTMENKGGKVSVDIRRAKSGEKIKVLTGEEYELMEDTFVFTDTLGGALLDIAGIKGGLSSGVTEATTDIFLSAGTYDPTLLRRASQKLKLFSDASMRYQNRPSPELTAYGMRNILALITEVAGGTCIGVVDFYPKKQEVVPVSVSFFDINKKLGSAWTPGEIEKALGRLGMSSSTSDDTLTIMPPFERQDIRIKEDVVEEVGRILGYDKIPTTPLPVLATSPDQARFNGIERIKDILIERGLVEISTPSFAAEGEIMLANPLDKTKPYLRATLVDNMKNALIGAVLTAPRVLGPEDAVKLFEIGNVFTKAGERLQIVLGYRPLVGKRQPILDELLDVFQTEFKTWTSDVQVKGETVELELSTAELERFGKEYEPRKVALQKFKPFSQYPFALRDVAVWSPEGTEESEVSNSIFTEGGELLARMDLFDRFGKEGRVSHAFRLVFESYEKTLSDADLNPIMERITNALNAKEGWKVR